MKKGKCESFVEGRCSTLDEACIGLTISLSFQKQGLGKVQSQVKSACHTTKRKYVSRMEEEHVTCRQHYESWETRLTVFLPGPSKLIGRFSVFLLAVRLV